MLGTEDASLTFLWHFGGLFGRNQLVLYVWLAFRGQWLLFLAGEHGQNATNRLAFAHENAILWTVLSFVVIHTMNRVKATNEVILLSR